MKDFLLALGVLLCSAYDVHFTRWKLMHFKGAVELNPTVGALASHLGQDLAIVVAILAPTMVLVVLGVGLHWSTFLAFLLGVKGCVAWFQHYSQRFIQEHEIPR